MKGWEPEWSNTQKLMYQFGNTLVSEAAELHFWKLLQFWLLLYTGTCMCSFCLAVQAISHLQFVGQTTMVFGPSITVKRTHTRP